MEKSTDAPILLIKTAWDGKTLNTDFRPPGAGPYVFNETLLAGFRKQGKDLAAIQAEKEKATGGYYRMMVDQVKMVLADIKRVVAECDYPQGYELAGFVRFQGWNDLVDGRPYANHSAASCYEAYSNSLAHFIRDVRNDLNTPKLPLVIGVLGVGGPTSEYGPGEQRCKSTHQNFRVAMAAPALMPEFKGNVATIRTERYWDQELSAAKAKDSAIMDNAKTLAAPRKLNPAKASADLEKMRMEGVTEREQLVLEKGISNQEFLYLGSARILDSIGKGLAEAMLELRTANR